MKFRKSAFLGLMILGLSSSFAFADAKKGQRLYAKKLRMTCGFKGAEMSAKHSQDQWKKIFDSGNLKKEIMKECPSAKGIKDSYLPHLYDFFYKYANDSGEVPSC